MMGGHSGCPDATIATALSGPAGFADLSHALSVKVSRTRTAERAMAVNVTRDPRYVNIRPL
jgi:hypothetical protein